MTKEIKYTDVSYKDMNHYIPLVISSILNGTDFPVDNRPSVNRFISDFYKAYMNILLHSESIELPYVMSC